MEMPSLADVNWVIVLVAVVVNMVVGFVWYSKQGFGKQWQALVGKSDAELKGDEAMIYGATIVLAVIEAIFLSFVVEKFAATNLTEGALVGIMVWVGVVLPTSLVTTLFSKIRKNSGLLITVII